MSKAAVTRPQGTTAVDAADILADLRELIHSVRHRVATVANTEQTLLYWRLGKRILSENLTEGRAEYGKRILATLSQELVTEFGDGFNLRNLYRSVQFTESFPDERIVATLSTQLSWSHFIEILPINAPIAREFYAEMCRVERWSVRTLRQKIGGMLYERTALSKNTDAVIKTELKNLHDGQMTPDMVFRDPYLLDFLGLKGAFSEKDLENAILQEMERFLLELGSGFSFVARQKRMSVGKDDFYLDLLFYHRFLRRLVAIELKLESFKPSHTGQMELYLRWLDKHERATGEESPIGLILCAGADAEQVELLQLDEKSIHVAEYLTELPPIELLRSRLHLAIELAREQAARRDADGE
jgi:predicted nuclease of restriction endonuclease-like (RecB) superfamily